MPRYGGTVTPAPGSRPRPQARPRSGRSPLARGCLRVAGVVSVLGALFAGWFWFWPTPESLDRRWQRQAGFDPLVVYPHREANAPARRIEELVAPLGIAIAPEAASGRPRPSEDAVARHAGAWEALKEYDYGLRRAVPELTAPPPEVGSLLAEAAPTLAEVAALLGGTELPRWELELEQGIFSRLPDLLGHLTLHRLLLATAAGFARRGDSEQALHWLDASWRLREALGEDPYLISQLVVHGELCSELALLRAFQGPLPGWRQRLEPMPLRERAGIALRLESWSLVQSLRTGRWEEDISDRKILRFLFRPFGQRGVAHYVDFTDRAVTRLATEDLRAFDNERFFEEEFSRVPKWSVIARIVIPNYQDAWVKAAKVELDLELTRRVVEVRELMRAGDAAALESLRGEHPSVVDGIQWRYRIEPGAVAIEASDDLPLELKHPLPLEVRLPRPTADRQQGATKAAPTESGLAPGPARDSIGRR